LSYVLVDTACGAVAEASFDEVQGILDKSVALAAYARQAKNRDLEADADEIRMRASRRVDELRAQKETVGLANGGDATPERPTLASQAPAPESIEQFIGIEFIEIRNGLCRWPQGDPADLETFRFCGEAVGRAKAVYCPCHARIAYAPTIA
jgi:hypothetical protein